MAKQAAVYFPFRSPPATGQPRFPACRAWRIIARPAADFSASAAAVAANPSAIPAAPAGCLNGAYPVWVKSTIPENGQDLPGIRCIDGDGWHSDPQGYGWRIEYVGGGSLATDQFCYVVEFLQPTDSLDLAGQVNTPIMQPRVDRWDPVVSSAVAPNFVANPWTVDFIRPSGATGLVVWGFEHGVPGTRPTARYQYVNEAGDVRDINWPVNTLYVVNGDDQWAAQAMFGNGVSFGTINDGGVRCIRNEPIAATVRLYVGVGSIGAGGYISLQARWLFL